MHPNRSGSGERPAAGSLPQSSRGSRLGSYSGLPCTCDRWWHRGRPGVLRWDPGAACPAPSTARALAPPRARVTCGRGRGGPSRLRRLWPPARHGREVGARSKEAETVAAPARPRSEPRGCMARPARLCGLWALLLYVAFSPGALAAEVQPPVTNLSVSVENLCTIIWTWSPPEGVNPNCSLRYLSHFDDKQDKVIAPETRRSKEVPLNEEVCLQVASQCSANESEKPSVLRRKCISPPKGDPESAVTELQCIWHNLSYMKCSWLPGRNTSPDTNYTLYYWYSSLGKILQCENIYREGQHIGCSFKLTKEDSSFEQHSIQIMVKDNAGKIRPSFKIVSLTSCVKPGPPHIKHLFFKNDALFVLWKNPQNFSSRCLTSEVEVNSSPTELHGPFSVEEEKCQIPESDRNMEGISCFMLPGVLPDTAVYTVRVRVKTNKLCFDDNHLWSNWSEALSIGKEPNTTFYITMLLIIPVIVAGAVIVLLLYLKRLKIIIFPPIPDPGKIFKEMFGDQNDDTLHWKKYDIYEKQSKEETDSVVLIENLKKAPQ